MPCKVDYINRFKSSREQNETLKQLEEGRHEGESMIRLPQGERIEVQWCMRTMQHHWRSARMMEGVLRERSEAALLRRLMEKKK